MPWQAASSSIARTGKPEQPKGCLAGTAQGEVFCVELSLAFVLTNIIWFRQCEKPVDPHPPESQPSGRIVSWMVLGQYPAFQQGNFGCSVVHTFQVYQELLVTRVLNPWEPFPG